jgi:hypothetical protein
MLSPVTPVLSPLRKYLRAKPSMLLERERYLRALAEYPNWLVESATAERLLEWQGEITNAGQLGQLAAFTDFAAVEAAGLRPDQVVEVPGQQLIPAMHRRYTHFEINPGSGEDDSALFRAEGLKQLRQWGTAVRLEQALAASPDLPIKLLRRFEFYLLATNMRKAPLMQSVQGFRGNVCFIFTAPDRWRAFLGKLSPLQQNDKTTETQDGVQLFYRLSTLPGLDGLLINAGSPKAVLIPRRAFDRVVVNQ